MVEYECKECSREFSNKEALEMHNRSKHFEKVKEPVDLKKYKKWGIFLVIALLIFGAAYGYSWWQNQPGKYDDFAQCLTDNGVKMYGAYWCPHCLDQKKEFGNSWQYVDYIECSLPNNGGQTQVCDDAGIEGYPTWELGDGTQLSGVQTFETLAEKSGCVLS